MRSLRMLALSAALASAAGCPKAGPAPADPTSTDNGEHAVGGDKDSDTRTAQQTAQARRISAAIESLERSYAKETQRWTPELRSKSAALVQAEYADTKGALDAVLAAPHRVPGNAARDGYRHPRETLLFFGLERNMRVVEMFPGGGWYTEVVAPVVGKHGKLVVPAYDPEGPEESFNTYLGRGVQLLLGKSPELFGNVERVMQKRGEPLDLGPAESADMVLAIREMHNWKRFGNWDEYLGAAHTVLKPGGILGVVQHRAHAGADPEKSAHKGYLSEAWLIEEVEKAGFSLVDKSEANANKRDTKDYEGGVWTLPPTLSQGKKNRDKYLAIGESDRMTLKFAKK